MRKSGLLLVLLLVASYSSAQRQKQTNKHFSHTLETQASPEAVWKLWKDVPHWKDWDVGLKDAYLIGDFDINSKGKIVSLEGRTSKFKVVAYQEGVSYTFKTKLPLGGLYVKRSLEKKDGTTFFTHEVWFKGLLAGIFAKKFGARFREMLPEAMQNIKNIVEE